MARTISPKGGIRPNNTTVTVEEGRTICTLYKTRIATFDPATDSVTLDTGGYDTPTTFRRMNECLRAWGFIDGARGSRFIGKGDFRTSNVRTYGREGLKP